MWTILRGSPQHGHEPESLFLQGLLREESSGPAASLVSVRLVIALLDSTTVLPISYIYLRKTRIAHLSSLVVHL